MSQEQSISERVERVEEIIETLEDGEVSLERANELRDEGEELLDGLRSALDVGEGEITERTD
jgi:exodeoxyribonuclease VII small subunit